MAHLEHSVNQNTTIRIRINREDNYRTVMVWDASKTVRFEFKVSRDTIDGESYIVAELATYHIDELGYDELWTCTDEHSFSARRFTVSDTILTCINEAIKEYHSDLRLSLLPTTRILHELNVLNAITDWLVRTQI